MARKREDVSQVDFTLDTTEEEVPQVVIPASDLTKTEAEETDKEQPVSNEPTVNCLRNEKIIVRHISRQQGNITDPRHVLYGGMSNNAIRTYSVPKLSSGLYVNVLTNAEKAFLEKVMGYEHNKLSIHRKVDNYWNDGENEAARVTLTKQDTILDLSNPSDYIKYKILLANKDAIAPNLQTLTDYPKATYQFVLINQGDETKAAKRNMSNTQRCYKEFGKIEDDKETLRLIVETLTGKPTASNVSLDFLQTKANELIQGDSKMFLSVITDELLQTKVLIKRAVEAGLIAQRANQFYYRETNTPLCEYNEEATMTNAAKYLNQPKHQDILFALQAKLN